MICGRWPLGLYRCGKVPASERGANSASPAKAIPATHCMAEREAGGFPYTCQMTWRQIWNGPSATAAIFRNS